MNIIQSRYYVDVDVDVDVDVCLNL